MEMLGTVDNNLLSSFFRLMDCFFEQYEETEGRKVTDADISKLAASYLQDIFLFCAVWSIGASCDAASRPKFSEWFIQHGEDLGFDRTLLRMNTTGCVYEM